MTVLAPPSPKASMLLAYLCHHKGESNGVSARDLAKWFNWPEREVRHLVTELRDHGEPVLGHPARGYFTAANVEEIDRSISFLVARAQHSLRLARRLRTVARPRLAGQPKLEVVS